MDAEDPLFLLYTRWALACPLLTVDPCLRAATGCWLIGLFGSGSTGRPKGVVHSHGGYMVWAATTFKYTFDYHADDVYWCTADIGWITGRKLGWVCWAKLGPAASKLGPAASKR